MTTVNFHKVTALPGTLASDSVYMVSVGANHTEVYVTSSTGVARRVLNEADINALIQAQIAGLASLEVVADIAARDALSPTANTQVMVLDASADATVTAGAATYLYTVSSDDWTKISEAESMDVILSWAAIQNKPTSTVADIDSAVAQRHTHANMTELNNIGQDSDGNMTYNGALPKIAWETTAW